MDKPLSLDNTYDFILKRVLYFCSDDATVAHNLAEVCRKLQSQLTGIVVTLWYKNAEHRNPGRFCVRNLICDASFAPHPAIVANSAITHLRLRNCETVGELPPNIKGLVMKSSLRRERSFEIRCALPSALTAFTIAWGSLFVADVPNFPLGLTRLEIPFTDISSYTKLPAGLTYLCAYKIAPTVLERKLPLRTLVLYDKAHEPIDIRPMLGTLTTCEINECKNLGEFPLMSGRRMKLFITQIYKVRPRYIRCRTAADAFLLSTIFGTRPEIYISQFSDDINNYETLRDLQWHIKTDRGIIQTKSLPQKVITIDGRVDDHHALPTSAVHLSVGVDQWSRNLGDFARLKSLELRAGMITNFGTLPPTLVSVRIIASQCICSIEVAHLAKLRLLILRGVYAPATVPISLRSLNILRAPISEIAATVARLNPSHVKIGGALVEDIDGSLQQLHSNGRETVHVMYLW